ELNLRNQSGGYELISIDKNDRLSIEFIVREKKQRSNSLDGSLLSVFGKITVKDVAKDTDPAPVVAFALRIIPRGMTAADMNPKIDAATRAQVIEAAISKLDEYYVFPEIAKKMDESVQAKLNSGGYDDATASNDFADKLMEDLRTVSHDKHLRIDFSPQVLPKRDPNANQTPDPVAIARVRTQLESINCSFERVDWLPSNIGYLKLNGFNDPEICGPTVIAAMNFLAHTNALIIDLRENNGGSAKMLPYICSYFFTEPTHLSDVYYRKEDKTTETWTSKEVQGARFVDKPILILTANRTFSAAEAFAYDMKNLKRATIIGETTGGGAHPITVWRLDDHFTITVPSARAISPITKTDWEGTGVEPDIKVPAAEALDVAKRVALE